MIKGYLPVRVKLPTVAIGSEDEQDETFFFVREHREGNTAAQTKEGGSKNATLFIANAPIVPGVKTKLVLKALLGKLGDAERVTLVENPRKAASKETPSSLFWASNLKEQFPTCLSPIHSTEKFAHVVFTSFQQMRRALKSLSEIMSKKRENGEFPGLELEKLELQILKDETIRLYKEEMGDDEATEEIDEKSAKKGILVVADRYRKSLASLSRENLLEQCNEVMQEYEEAEEAQRLAREAAANEPDEDGFITVTSKSVGVEGGKNELEKDKGAAGKRRRSANKRNRKKKDSVGATELQDFYRFQRKETRKRTLQDLRKQFEEDLKKVKKMKDNHEYKPF